MPRHYFIDRFDVGAATRAFIKGVTLEEYELNGLHPAHTRSFFDGFAGSSLFSLKVVFSGSASSLQNIKTLFDACPNLEEFAITSAGYSCEMVRSSALHNKAWRRERQSDQSDFPFS